MYTGEMFELDDCDRDLIARKIAPDPNSFRKSWEELVSATLEEATLALPSSKFAQKGGRNGVHSEHLGHLLAEMQFLQRAYPDASW
jgi:ring-1,2-phenylacetyl-CoA epoxidase subunit PaaC